MKKSLFILLALVIGLGAFSLPPKPVQAASFIHSSSESGDIVVSKPISDDLMTAGNTVSVGAAVAGELFAAGNSVSVSEAVGRSVWAAGNTVAVEKGSGYNAFLAGNAVTLSGTYAHDVYVAGNTIIIKEGTVINGQLRASGKSLTLNGTVKGDVYFTGQSFSSSAVIGGSVHGWGSDFTFMAGSIAGDFKYESSKDATGLDTVKVTGTTQRSEPKNQDQGVAGLVGFFILSMLGTLFLAYLLVLFRHQQLEDISEMIEKDRGTSFLRGLAFFVLVPIAIIIGFALIIGWQVAIVLGLAYVAFLIFAHAISCIWLGSWILEKATMKKQSLWWGALVGVIVIGILGNTPAIGWIFGAIFSFWIVLPVLGASITPLLERQKPKSR